MEIEIKSWFLPYGTRRKMCMAELTSLGPFYIKRNANTSLTHAPTVFRSSVRRSPAA